MRRTLAPLLAAAILVSIPPIGDLPAAAVGRDRVLRCNGCWPAAFAFTPNGEHIFYAERLSGEIRKFTLDGRKDRRWARIPDVAGGGEQGVLGLALDPEWDQGPKQQWVYVYYTEENPHRNRIIRLRRRKGGVKKDRLVSLAANDFHDGGVLHFAADGKLYAVTGDAQVASRAQEKGNLAGKVLRLEQNGGRPGDNPIGGSKAFSYGHRNSFGFAFDPMTGNLWQTENGPDCDDEVNLILPGHNYGWGGASECPDISESGPNPEQPKLKFNPVVALTGAAFCVNCGLGPEVEGDLLIGSYIGGKIRNLTLNPARDGIAEQGNLYDHGSFVLAVEAAPDGLVYFSDRNGIYRLR